jgi:phage baseplate assembly protein W
MLKSYYEMPLQFRRLMKRNTDLPTCDLKKSIAQNIFLIITSKFNEHRFDTSYGCELWDMDFEIVVNESMWTEKIRKSVQVSVEKHETRLYDIDVQIEVAQDENVFGLKNEKSVKKLLSIFVKGTISETGESFPFNTKIFLSPLSLE